MFDEALLYFLFIFLFVSAILIFYFAYILNKENKGEIVGWNYLVKVGVWAGINSILGIINVLTTDYEITYIFTWARGISLLFISYYILIANTSMLADIGMKVKFFNKRNFVILSIILAVIILLINVRVLATIAATTHLFYTITMYVMALGYLFALFPLYKLLKVTKKAPWAYLFISILLFSVSMLTIGYSGSCCSDASPLHMDTVCEGKQRLGMEYLDGQFCNPWVVSIYTPSMFLLMIAELFTLAAYYSFCRAFFKIKPFKFF